MASSKMKKIEIIPPKDIWVGKDSATIRLVMFGDYESELCAKANQVVNKILDEYKTEVKFNFRHFPLTRIHQHSHKAAEAAVAAAQEGKFWPMHNALFAHRKNLGTTSLKIYAKEIGVTNKKFLPELIDSVYGWQVRNDLLCGVEKGVNDVPAFFINDELYTGKVNLPELSKVIDKTLLQSKNQKAIKHRA